MQKVLILLSLCRHLPSGQQDYGRIHQLYFFQKIRLVVLNLSRSWIPVAWGPSSDDITRVGKPGQVCA